LAAPPLRAGERWQLLVRLKRPHGLMNPHGFDYELWLFEQDLRATGVVRPGVMRRLEAAPLWSIDRWRQSLREALQREVTDASTAGVLAALSLWLLNRYYRTHDPLFWMLTSSGVLLIASWLVLSLAQGYYSMMLFPFLMTVVLKNSVLRNWPAWLAIYGFLTLDRWLMWRLPTTGRFLEYMKITYGWSLMLIVVFCVLYFRYLDAKAEGRLEDGIDPAWMAPSRRPPAPSVTPA
jgi:hypothetical protein